MPARVRCARCCVNSEQLAHEPTGMPGARRGRPARPLACAVRAARGRDLSRRQLARRAAEGRARERGLELRLVEADDIPAQLDTGLAVLMLTHVNYRSGRMHDMASLTRRAHAAGALVVWDLAHSAGAVPVDLLAAD